MRRDKQEEGDKKRKSEARQNRGMRGGGGHKDVSARGTQQDVIPAELLKKRICSTAEGQSHIEFLFSPLNERTGSGDRLLQPSSVTLPSHHSSHTEINIPPLTQIQSIQRRRVFAFIFSYVQCKSVT